MYACTSQVTTRSSAVTVTFARPFKLPNMDREFPAGDYEIEIDDEPLDSLLMLGYRRTATRIWLHTPGVTQILTITQQDLDAALAGDVAAKEPTR